MYRISKLCRDRHPDHQHQRGACENYLDNLPWQLDVQEIQTAKDRSQELIDKILRRSKVILDGLLRVASSPNRDQLKDIEGKLKDYNEYGS